MRDLLNWLDRTLTYLGYAGLPKEESSVVPEAVWAVVGFVFLCGVLLGMLF